MIDPLHVTDFDRSDAELQEFFLYAVLVANKNSDRIARGLDFILRQGEPGDTPFETIKRMVLDGSMTLRLTQAKTGEYTRRLTSMAQVAAGMVPNLRNATPDDLEMIHGVGKKTSRFFIMHTRRNTKHAAIDTHILKFLRDMGVEDVPDKTPVNDAEYRRLELAFLAEVEHTNTDAATLDLELWTLYSGRAA